MRGDNFKSAEEFMKITNIVTIKNYDAGRNGNLLVSLDENLENNLGYHVKDQAKTVKMLICTAVVSDPNEQAILKKHCDDSTPCDRVIVVSSQFLKLFNKTQLILIERQNAKEDFPMENCDMDTQIHAEIETMTRFGTWRSMMAFDKERKIREKDEKEIGKARHSEYKSNTRKNARAMKKGGKLSNVFGKKTGKKAAPKAENPKTETPTPTPEPAAAEG
jgi:hypothetical protein